MRRKGSHFKQTKQKHICDPGMCDHCIYIGEGDFLCDKFHDEKGNPAILVMAGWERTENYQKCRKGKQKDG